MKAVRIHQYGDASQLVYEDAPLPELNRDDVLVKVVAASVNPVDWKIRDGHLVEMIHYDFPLILGWDVSGVVESIGVDVTRFKVGDAVFSRPDVKRNGCYAEYVAVAEYELALKPKTISHVEAASLPLAGITAWEALFNTAKLKSGQSVLIHAGAGGVGSLAIQLAKNAGAIVYTTTSGRNVSLVQSLGANEVIDYERYAFNKELRNMDVVFDTLGGRVQDESWEVLKPNGIMVSIYSKPSDEQAKKLGVRSAFIFIDPNAAILNEMATLVDEGKLRPIVGAEFALEHVKKAHELSEAGHAIGKIVLHVGHP